MPRISSFYGIVIRMYWNERDHPVAHFHAEYEGRFASVALNGSVLAGNFRPGPSEWSAGGRNCTPTSFRRTGKALVSTSRSRRSILSRNIETMTQFPHSSTSQASR
jgi:hypothetical protein